MGGIDAARREPPDRQPLSPYECRRSNPRRERVHGRQRAGLESDSSTFYFVDTVPGIIYAYDFDAREGSIANRRVFVTVPEAEGRPDGLAVDADGGVWCAIWDGWRVNRYRPDGRLDRAVELPVPRPTSVAFGGDELATLFITSARTRLPASTLTEAPLSGGIFACNPGARGLPTSLFGV